MCQVSSLLEPPADRGQDSRIQTQTTMNLSSITLGLMRQSAGAAIAAAALSGSARAELPAVAPSGLRAAALPLKSETRPRLNNNDEKKKSGEEEPKKKEEKREPCPACGLG